MSSSNSYQDCFPAEGKVAWIGVRPGRGEPVCKVESVEATIEQGLAGDRFAGKPGAPRQVTLIQQEHLIAMAGLLNQKQIDPALTRRNIVVSGINLTALKGAEFSIGEAILRGTGPCAPCGQMERNLGEGGYNAMRGHGGITASVVRGGVIVEGDPVRFLRRVPESAEGRSRQTVES